MKAEDHHRRPGSPDELIAAVEPERRRLEALRLDAIFRDVSGFRPRVWRSGILGYGTYDYTYATGRSGTYLATGFAPKKANQTLYIMPGYADFDEILARLGPHRAGKSCIYVSNLDRVDEAALRELIRAGLDRLEKMWPVMPTVD